MKLACSNCRFFANEHRDVPINPMSNVGECRSRPPIYVRGERSACFPPVRRDHWCGAFQPFLMSPDNQADETEWCPAMAT